MEIGAAETSTSQVHELTLTRLIDVPREKLFAAWADPKLVEQWWCPKPWSTQINQYEFRPLGKFDMLMKGPEGEQAPCVGVFLEIVPNEKVVFTDAFQSAWIPSGKAFIVATLTFTDEAGQTRYTATVRHWSEEDLKQHEQMGFHDGWSIVFDQITEIARAL